MSIDQHVVHRKVFSPWYDTDSVCVAALMFTVLVGVFCLAGISVCDENAAFQNYIWIPVLLMVLSGILFVSIFIRLAKRYVVRYQNRYLKDFPGNGL